MKRTVWTALLLSLALLLTSCGQGTSAPGRDVPTPEAEEAPRVFDVENNGGYYVWVDGKTYFRKYGPSALEKTLVYGEFLNPYAATGGESEIMRYDPETGAVESLFTDTGYGPLYFGDGGLYLQERVYGRDLVVWYSTDGAECRTICDGQLLGVSEGGLLAVERFEADDYAFCLYRDGVQQAVCYQSDEEAMIFAGLSDDGLFFLRTEEDNGGEVMTMTRTLWQLDPDNELIRLGTLSETDVSYDTEPEQFLTSWDEIGVVAGYYAGSGHFLNDYEIVTATTGVADSLSPLDFDASGGDVEGALSAPKLTRNVGGELIAVGHDFGDLAVAWEEGEEGDLKFYDASGWVTLQRDSYDFPAPGSGWQKRVQSMEYVDGVVYVTLAVVYASPVHDFGWRDAYTLLDMLYLAVPVGEGYGRELACVDHNAALTGNVWFTDGDSAVIWQEISLDPDADPAQADRAYKIPIARDAEWESREAILSDAVRVTPDAPTERYDAYEVPQESGQFLSLRLNRDGEAAFLTPVSPDALLSIEIGVDEAELSGASETLDIAPRPSDEDTPWYWAKLTALQDGVTVRMERVAENQTTVSEQAREENRVFIPGEILLDRGFNRGEYVMARVSLPWYPELRVSVLRDGTWGAYVFGEDNFERAEPVDGRFPEMTLAGYPVEETDAPAGLWMYRDPATKDYTAALSLDGTGPACVETDENGYWLSWKMDWLYAETWEPPDLLSLSTDDAGTIAALNGMEGDAGDYLVERYRTDGETILHMVQANNGDAALDKLLPNQSQGAFAFTFHSYEGVAEPAPPVRNRAFTAKIVKVDRDKNAVWLQEAEAFDGEYDDDATVYRPNPYQPCVLCWLDNPGLLDAFDDCTDPEYPMRVCEVVADRYGMMTSLTVID